MARTILVGTPHGAAASQRGHYRARRLTQANGLAYLLAGGVAVEPDPTGAPVAFAGCTADRPGVPWSVGLPSAPPVMALPAPLLPDELPCDPGFTGRAPGVPLSVGALSAPPVNALPVPEPAGVGPEVDDEDCCAYPKPGAKPDAKPRISKVDAIALPLRLPMSTSAADVTVMIVNPGDPVLLRPSPGD
jgi:hypothetical protein